jgi:hypothetical protein
VETDRQVRFIGGLHLIERIEIADDRITIVPRKVPMNV